MLFIPFCICITDYDDLKPPTMHTKWKRMGLELKNISTLNYLMFLYEFKSCSLIFATVFGGHQW